ncbi:MAG: helix-turn-helix domain-containing protein [Phocaeicola sp.]
MIRKLLLLLILATSFCTLAAQRRSVLLEKELETLRKEPENGEVLQFLCQYYLSQGDYSKTVTYAEYMKGVGDKRNNLTLILYSYIYQGEAQRMSGREKTAHRNLQLALDMATQLKNDSALCLVYGSLGLYAAHTERDYYHAIRWLFKGVVLAQHHNYTALRGELLGKLASVYYLKRDKAGLSYAEECYEIGHSLNKPALIYEGAVQCASMHLLLKEYKKAMDYLNEAEGLLLEHHFYDQAHTYNLLGDLLAEEGEYTQALAYYKKALMEKQASKTSSIVYAHLGEARVRIKQQYYSEAIALIKQGLAISYARANTVYRKELYEALSLSYEKLHMYADALSAYKTFRAENDTLTLALNERDLSELRFRYDSERQANAIKENKLMMLEKEQRIQQQMYILIIILIVLGLLYYLYRRKNRLYLRIVKQNQEAIRKEDKLRKRIEALEQNSKHTLLDEGQEGVHRTKELLQEKYASSSLSDEKSVQIFQQLEILMQEQKRYKESTLNKERVAEELGTNRTYLSRIINEQTGLSFTHYINKYRIEEAVRILSDPTNQTPLKAISAELGFNAISTFYNLFQSKVGMTPAQYRNKVLELERGS